MESSGVTREESWESKAMSNLALKPWCSEALLEGRKSNESKKRKAKLHGPRAATMN